LDILEGDGNGVRGDVLLVAGIEDMRIFAFLPQSSVVGMLPDDLIFRKAELPGYSGEMIPAEPWCCAKDSHGSE
jgi:hypothetical protein